MDFYGGGARRPYAQKKEMVILRDNFEDMQYLMRVNVGDRRLRENANLLLVGSCMDRFPDNVEEVLELDGKQLTPP